VRSLAEEAVPPYTHEYNKQFVTMIRERYASVAKKEFMNK